MNPRHLVKHDMHKFCVDVFWHSLNKKFSCLINYHLYSRYHVLASSEEKLFRFFFLQRQNNIRIRYTFSLEHLI